MKFPITVEEFIAEQEKLWETALTSAECKYYAMIVDILNRIYQGAKRGELPGEVPYAPVLQEQWGKLGAELDDGLATLFKILGSWCDYAMEQGLADRDELPGLRFTGEMISLPMLKDCPQVPLYELATPEGKPDINTLEGWNATARIVNRRSFREIHGRDPVDDLEVEHWVAHCAYGTGGLCPSWTHTGR